MTQFSKPRTDSELQNVLESEIKEWHFHIYFHTEIPREHKAALELRDAVLRLRRDGAFVAVPLLRVDAKPFGPHPIGSYEIWVPSESFVSVYSYLVLNRGELSVLVHPLTREVLKDHEARLAWIGPSYPLFVNKLSSFEKEEVPLQYPSLKLGYSSTMPQISVDDRLMLGESIEAILESEDGAEKAPPRAP